MSSDIVVKPIATSVVAFAIDKFILNENDTNKSITFGASCGAGAYLGMMVGSNIPDIHQYLPTYLGNGKGLLQRVAEIGLGTGTSFIVNQYILKNTSYRENIYNKIGAIAAADIAGEYISDFIAGRPLSILA